MSGATLQLFIEALKVPENRCLWNLRDAGYFKDNIKKQKAIRNLQAIIEAECTWSDEVLVNNITKWRQTVTSNYRLVSRKYLLSFGMKSISSGTN